MTKISDQALRNELEKIPIGQEDIFFSNPGFVPGRVSDGPDRVIQPQESLIGYEDLLAQIRRVLPKRYPIMHKGTPFYLTGWLAYEMRNFEKGVFYMDAALSEDTKNDPSGWTDAPAAAFIFLNDRHPKAVANGITFQARNEIDSHLTRFSSESGLGFDIGTLVDKFFRPHARDAAYRSIITSLLTFLLEGKDLQLQIGLRSHHGGSLEPFLTHLFKGGLIFESLLKRKYGASGNTLGPYLNAGKADLSLSSKPLYKELSTPIKLEDIPAFLQNWSGKDFHEGAIAIAYAVRNTTGHDLGWQDIFTEDVYKVLFDGIVNAIFWVIKKAYNV